ncbi:IS1182 family transposase [Streptomyces sp. NPDC055243]|uniref:IS1182 family transposase n=1 Tax=Streptomyces sp. NPDC055243 TaxID=3365720 RepID=UPI0037D95F6C
MPDATARVARLAFRKGCLAMRLRDEIGVLFEDEQFVEAFPSRGGPGLSPGMLALVSVLQYAENLTDRQAAEQVKGRIDWKYALSLELEDPGFDFSVLCGFRARLIEHGLEEKILDMFLQRAKEMDLLRAGGLQRTDSTHVLAAIRTLNRMELAGETLRAALEAVTVAAPAWLAQVAPRAWFERYGGRVDAYRLPRAEGARQDYLITVGQDGFALLEAIWTPEAPAWLRQLPAIEILRRTWVQQFHRGQDSGVSPRRAKDKDLPPGKLLLCSPYDPEARYSVKRGFEYIGYKVHLSEVCEPGQPHLITNVETTHAAVGDVEMTGIIHTHQAKRAVKPGEHLVDAGYTSAEHLVSARAKAINLVGPLQLSTSQQSKDGGRFALPAFVIDFEHQHVTCPDGKTSSAWREETSRGAPLIRVAFRRNDCKPCSLRAQCTSTALGGQRRLTIRPQPLYEEIETARHNQDSDEWKERYAVRAGVEGTMNQAVRVTGVRTTRYRGLDRTRLAHVLTATALNVVRLDAWWTGTPISPTRASHFARLGMALAA